MISLKAHYDGKVFVPEEPPALAPNQKVRITVEPVDSFNVPPTKPGARPGTTRVFGQQPGAFTHIAPDFDEPLSESFWLGEDDAE